MVSKMPVPKTGDMNTSLDKVKKFYRFWSNFSSQRDFSVGEEFDLGEATSKFQKRQILKENRKMKASLLKEEKMRIDSLINIALSLAKETKSEEEIKKEYENYTKLEPFKFYEDYENEWKKNYSLSTEKSVKLDISFKSNGKYKTNGDKMGQSDIIKRNNFRTS